MRVAFLVSLLSILSAPAAAAEDACSSIDSFCGEGISVTNAMGSCTPRFLVCDDLNEDTESSCDPDLLICSHSLPPGSDGPVCKLLCTPSCDGKQCGEDECGGFCGSCPEGTGCSNFACVAGLASGSCDSPLPLGSAGEDIVIAPSARQGSSNATNGGGVTIIDTDTRISMVTRGDTTQAVHSHTPSCNTLTASPELIFSFQIPAGQSYGYDFRSFGYDTVLQLMKDDCGSSGQVGVTEDNFINCNDDGTPPGDLGSKISGMIGEGTYYIMVDGYSTTDAGPFELITTFVRDCEPLCDGNFCGDDSCGGSCGSCLQGFACNTNDYRCYEENCQPACSDRECGEDGCGGSCGECGDGLLCLGESITPAEEEGEGNATTIPSSSCEAFPVCDHMNPVCDAGCSDEQICGSDCMCYDSIKDLADLVVLEDSMLQESYLQDLLVPESSCTLIEGCVKEPGLRRLYRFTSTVLNQGHVDISFPEPKDRPDLFEFGPCHQHYHFRQFAEYTLFAEDGTTVVMHGQKFAYCMEDTARHFDGADVNCDKTYDCGSQGISRGWLDSYGWSLDCSWLDITDLPPGKYVLQIEANPARVFPEVSFDNNKASIRVTIPDITETVSVPMKLETDKYSPITPSIPGETLAPEEGALQGQEGEGEADGEDGTNTEEEVSKQESGSLSKSRLVPFIFALVGMLTLSFK